MAIVPAFLILTTGYGQFTHLSTVVMTLGGLSILIFTTDTIGKTIFLQLILGNINTVVSVILNMVRHTLSLSYPTLVLMLAVISPIVYLFALKHWAKALRFIADNLHAEVSSLIALSIVTMVVVYLIPIYPAQSFFNHPVYCTFIMLAVECGFFLYIYTPYRNLLKVRYLLGQEAKEHLLETKIPSYQKYLNGAKQSRHDLRHHNTVIAEHMQNGESEKALAYLQTNEEELASTALAQFCKNPTANAVLRIYSWQALANGIPFVTGMDLHEELPISTSELGTLLSNFLENALEACIMVEPIKRQLAISTQTDDSGLRLEIRNSVSSTVAFEDELPVSTKAGGGTGTRSIANLVQKHGEMLRFKQEGDLFLTQILLPISQ